jgi:hypothetical protein
VRVFADSEEGVCAGSVVLGGTSGSSAMLRFNEKFRQAAPPVLQSVAPQPSGSGYTFALEQRVLEESKAQPASRTVEVEVRFEGVTQRLALPRVVSGAALLAKLCRVCGVSQAEQDVHVEVGGAVLSDLGHLFEMRPGLLVAVAAAARGQHETGEERIPCDRCGVAVLVADYLEHETSCRV